MADIQTDIINLQYKCKKIISQNDFNKLQEYISDSHEINNRYKGNIYDIWNKINTELLPGKASDGTKAMTINVCAKGITKLEDIKIFAQTYLLALNGLFQAENVLSCTSRSTDDEVSCIGIVIPFVGRTPDADKFLSKIHPDQLSDKYKSYIEENLAKEFPNIMVTGKTTITDKKALGYQPALVNFTCQKVRKEDDHVLHYVTDDNDNQIQTILPYDEILTIINQTIVYFTTGPEATTFEMSQEGRIGQKDFLNKIKSYLLRYHGTVRGSQLQDSDLQFIMSRIYRWAYGFYILDPLINADEISDIIVMSYDNIRVKVGSERYTSNFKFQSETDYRMFIQGIAVRNNLDLHQSAIHVFSDITTNDNFRLRMNIVTNYITDGHFYLHIRKIAKKKRDFGYLLKAGMLDETLMNYLIDRARYGKGMIFTGKGASGKTTLMNTLLDKIPFDKSGDVIQESEELFSDTHPHLMFQHVTVNSKNERMRYDLKDLARNGLLTDLDYFIIGEVKGAEAKYFINAADTGHKCWCSVHAPSALDAIDKLADYVTYESDYSKVDAEYMLKDLGTVIFMKDFKVCEIAEISGWDKEKKCLTYTPVYLRPGMDHSAFYAAL